MSQRYCSWRALSDSRSVPWNNILWMWAVPVSVPRRDGKPVAISEGITETSQYWQKHLLGKLLYTRLITNNHPMSATANQARRYMNYFVYWPLALHRDPKSALLICFGVGSTAKALTDAKSLKSIDVGGHFP